MSDELEEISDRVAHLRRAHADRPLEAAQLSDDPIRQFSDWLHDALDAGLTLPNAMALATATLSGHPSVRMVLLKAVDERGFVFYTNLESRKGREIQENPRAALVFHWSQLERQVRVTGNVEGVSIDEAREYFASRPRGSRLAAWASPQSRPLSTRRELDERMAEAQLRWPGEEVPLPPHWGGYRVVPEEIEFWQGREDRLHDRFLFRRGADGAWRAQRLAP